MEGGAVRDIGAADRSEGERSVGEESGERNGQGIHLGERGKGCESICGSEPVKTWESGELGTNRCDEVLNILLAVGPSMITEQSGVPLA